MHTHGLWFCGILKCLCFYAKLLGEKLKFAGNGWSHSRQLRPNIGLGDEIHP